MLLKSSEIDDSSVELWASLVEQGLVPLLEILCSGCPVSHSCDVGKGKSSIERSSAANTSVTNGLPRAEAVKMCFSLFPEDHIRESVNSLLSALAGRLECSAAVRSRLASDLQHSGNPKLRTNIFTGLAFLAARSLNLGRLNFIYYNLINYTEILYYLTLNLFFLQNFMGYDFVSRSAIGGGRSALW